MVHILFCLLVYTLPFFSIKKEDRIYIHSILHFRARLKYRLSITSFVVWLNEILFRTSLWKFSILELHLRMEGTNHYRNCSSVSQCLLCVACFPCLFSLPVLYWMTKYFLLLPTDTLSLMSKCYLTCWENSEPRSILFWSVVKFVTEYIKPGVICLRRLK